MRPFMRCIGSYLALSAMLGLVLLVQAYPELPSRPSGWLAVFLLAVPIQIACELVGVFFWKNRVARYMEDATGGTPFSFIRIVYGVLALVLLIGVVAGGAVGLKMVQGLL